MALQLRVVTGPDAGRAFTLQAGDDLMIGRGQDCLYRLNDPHVARWHCQIDLDDDRVTMTCNAGNGATKVNGKAVQKLELKLGDVINFGNSELRLEMGDFPLDVAMGGYKGTPTPKSTQAEPLPDSLAHLEGQMLGHFHIGHVIGSGKSKLFFATDLNNGRPVTLKVFLPEFSTNEEQVKRFVSSMKTALPLKHPNIVQTYSAGKSEGYCWTAMEYIAGENAKQLIDRIGVAGMLDWRVSYSAALHVARGLAFAHALGVVHRNLTPSNVLRDAPTKTFKISDLVLAKSLDKSLANKNPMMATRPGELIGDLDYTSPEGTRGIEADERSDLYGLGALVYALLTGRPPCQGKNIIERITRTRSVMPDKPAKFQMSIHSAFEGVVMKLLAKDPNDRFQKAADVVTELERIGKFAGLSA